jgi:micrococcal nuclease
MNRNIFHIISFAAAFAGVMALAPMSSARNKMIEGPVVADVIRVIDGDTVEVKAYPWPQHSIDVLVRLRGIDAPEIHAKCAPERERAEKAQMRLRQLLENNGKIYLTDIGGEKYFGRVLANVVLFNGNDAAHLLINESLVQPYNGGKKPKPNCG